MLLASCHLPSWNGTLHGLFPVPALQILQHYLKDSTVATPLARHTLVYSQNAAGRQLHMFPDWQSCCPDSQSVCLGQRGALVSVSVNKGPDDVHEIMLKVRQQIVGVCSEIDKAVPIVVGQQRPMLVVCGDILPVEEIDFVQLLSHGGSQRSHAEIHPLRAPSVESIASTHLCAKACLLRVCHQTVI